MPACKVSAQTRRFSFPTSSEAEPLAITRIPSYYPVRLLTLVVEAFSACASFSPPVRSSGSCTTLSMATSRSRTYEWVANGSDRTLCLQTHSPRYIQGHFEQPNLIDSRTSVTLCHRPGRLHL